jgi:hypothetical protein
MDDHWFKCNNRVNSWCQNRDFSTIWGTPGRLSWFCGEFFGQQNENFPRLKGPLHGSRVSFVCVFYRMRRGHCSRRGGTISRKEIGPVMVGRWGEKNFGCLLRDFKLCCLPIRPALKCWANVKGPYGTQAKRFYIFLFSKVSNNSRTTAAGSGAEITALPTAAREIPVANTWGKLAGAIPPMA